MPEPEPEPGRSGDEIEDGHDIDLRRLAATLRGVMPKVDDEARERLEAAWVAVTNALKQPHVDTVRLRRRFARLRDELDAWIPLVGRAEDDDETPSAGS